MDPWARTVTTHLIVVRQADAFVRGRGYQPGGRQPGRLEAFIGDLLARRTTSTAATYHTVLKIRYGWLAEEEAIPTNPILSADSSPARANILAPRETLNLRSPGFARRRSVPLSYKGRVVVLVETAGGEPAPSTLPASRPAG
jgi:hypothetical protein